MASSAPASIAMRRTTSISFSVSVLHAQSDIALA